MIAKTLYEILGVPVDATEAQIKKAFRRRVKKSHPDVGGDPEKFREINHAYEVLSDPSRRQRYDETGQGGDPKVADAVQKAAMILSQLTLEVMNANPQGCNIVECIRRLIQSRIEGFHRAAERDRQGARTLRGVAENVLKTSEGDNLIAAILESHAVNCEANAKRQTEQGELMEDVFKMLMDYKWKPDETQVYQSRFISPNATNLYKQLNPQGT